MKFPYTPISYIIADVRAELKQLDQRGDILDEDCINWAIEALREIGGGNYTEDATIIHICNNVATLPDNWYVTDQIWLMDRADEIPNSSRNDNMLIWFSKESRNYRKKGLLFPGDSMTGSRFNKGNCPVNDNPHRPSYIIRHPRQIRCSIEKCTIGMTYLGLPTADNGEVMMQDEIYTIKATKAYIKRMLLSEKYYMQQLNENIWQNITREYEENLSQAQAIFKFPDQADAKAMGYDQDHRYDDFKLR